MKRILAFALIAWLVSCQVAWAAITFDAVTNSGNVSAGNVTFSHTVGGGCTNRIIVVGVKLRNADNGGSVSTLTIGGSAATFVDAQQGDVSRRSEFWYRKGVSTGSNSIVTTLTTGSEDGWIVTARSYCGVDQTTAVGTAGKAGGTGTTPTVNVTISAGDLLVDEMVWREAGGFDVCTVGAGQTERENTTLATYSVYGSSEEGGSGSVTMSWTCTASDGWAIVAVPLKPAAAAAARRVIVVE